MVEAGNADNVIKMASSHFASAEDSLDFLFMEIKDLMRQTWTVNWLWGSNNSTKRFCKNNRNYHGKNR